MKKYPLLIIAFFVCLSQASIAQNDALLKSEDARFAAQMSRDSLSLNKLLHPQLVYIHSNTLTETKADFILSVVSGSIIYRKIEAQNRVVRRYGKNYIVNGNVSVSGFLKKEAFVVKLKYTAIYLKKGHSYQLVSWQSTKIPQ